MPAISNLKPDDSNKGFLRALFAATVFMLISGVILVAGFLAWHYPQIAAGAKTKPIMLTGKDFYIAIGKGNHDGDKLILKELDEAGSAVISSRKALFNASRYPVVEYRITNRTPGAAVVLYWRTVTHNDATLFAKLHWNGDHLSAYNMSNEEEWKGAVTELGISVSGDLRNQPITIENVTFSPWTVRTLLLLVWTEWNAFEGWSQKSINVIRGMPKNALVSPVVAAAAWCGLAMLLYILWLFFYKTPKVKFQLKMEEAGHSVRQLQCNKRDPAEDAQSPNTSYSGIGWNPQPPTKEKPQYTRLSITRQLWDFKAIVIMFMIAWFVLDWKWQLNLWRQLTDTNYLYAEKSLLDKHIAAKDREIFRFIEKIRSKLPNKPQRIFIAINNKSNTRYIQLKALYYLLPHNVYSRNESAGQIVGKAKYGDYIVMIGDMPDVSYSSSDQAISYNLIPDGGFEESRHLSAYCKKCSYGNYSITDEKAVGGRFSLKQIGPPSGQYEVHFPGIYFPPGSLFNYTLWVSMEEGYKGNRMVLHGRVYYEDGSTDSWEGQRPNADGKWQKMEQLFAIKSDRKVSQVSLYIGYPTGVGVRYIDDIELNGLKSVDLLYQDQSGSLFFVK